MRLSFLCRCPFLWAAFFFLALNTSSAWGLGSFSLAEVLARVEAESPLLAASRARQHGAEGRLQTARAYPNPEVEISSGRSTARHADQLSGANSAFMLAQPIELPGVRRSRQHEAEAYIQAANAALQGSLRILTARVKHAFYEVLRREAEHQVAEENRLLMEQIRHRISLRVEEGEAPRYEMVKAETEYLSAVKAEESALLRVKQAKALLRVLANERLPDDFELTGGLPDPVSPPPLNELRERVIRIHPGLAEAAAQVEAARARAALERDRRFSQVTVRTGYQQDPDLDHWQMGLSVPLPLWNRREGPIAEAEAQITERTEELRGREQSLMNDLESAYAQYQIAVKQVESFEKGLLKEADAMLQAAETAYRLGARGILDYLDAQRSHRTVHSDYNNARFDRQAALIEIERLGMELTEGQIQ